MASKTEVVHSYRHLYRNLLRAVQYSSPSRFVVRQQLRRAFREPGATFDAEGVKRTNWFLEAAAKEKGIEHRILKNLVHVQLRREPRTTSWKGSISAKPDAMTEHRATAYHHYDMTVAMLNKTMGLHLR